MAQEIVVKLIVDDGQVEQATKDIEKLGGSIEKVNDTTVKTGKTLGDSMDSAGQATNNLKDGVEGAARQVRVLGRAAKTSGKAMRSALIATGIGALVVSVQLLVENWEAIGKSIGLITPTLEEQLEILKKTEATTQLRVDLLDKEIDLSKKQGKATEELQKQRINLVKIIQEQKKEQLALLESEAEELRTAGLTLTTRQKILKAILNAGKAGLGDAYILDQQSEAAERYKEIQDLILKSKIEQIDVETKLFDLQNPETKEARGQISAISFGGETGISDPYNEQKEKDAKSLQALREGTEEFAIAQNERLDIEVEALFKSAEIATQKTAIEKQASEERIAQAKAEADAKVGFEEILLKSTLSSLRSISMLFEEGTAASKAAAIAEIVIGTGVGFIQALDIAQKGAKATGPAAPFAFPIFYATQVAAVLSAASQAKNILSQTKGGDGGLGSINVAGGNGGQAPSFNVVGTGGVTQSQFQESLQAEDTPIRAYVVSGDVTSSQEFDRNVEDSSSIG